jgi:UPF0271 protein
MAYIDLNCDMGEGLPNDAALMPFISSANIACGYHAGNKEIMQSTVALAKQYQVAIGAHPGFDDKENFGRIEVHLSQKDLYRLVSSQIILMHKICVDQETSLHHVKPHGALYNMAANNAEIAYTIAQAIKDVDENLIVYGLSGSHLISAAKKMNLQTASEVFADRTYQDDGSLTSRKHSNALIEDEDQSMQQVLQMIQQQKVTTLSGKSYPLVAETICIHGDGKQALAFAKKINQTLQQHHIEIKTI